MQDTRIQLHHSSKIQSQAHRRETTRRPLVSASLDQSLSTRRLATLTVTLRVTMADSILDAEPNASGGSTSQTSCASHVSDEECLDQHKSQSPDTAETAERIRRTKERLQRRISRLCAAGAPLPPLEDVQAAYRRADQLLPEAGLPEQACIESGAEQACIGSGAAFGEVADGLETPNKLLSERRSAECRSLQPEGDLVATPNVSSSQGNVARHGDAASSAASSHREDFEASTCLP